MKIFAQKLLKWFDQHGRKNLPWQIQKTPYRVWVSEIMLQQTQVNTAIPFFLRFMERFPDLSALANAELDEVLHLWSGLGYYSRARNLHRCAQFIHHHYQGNFPEDQSLLEDLPGIGRSTAAAIMALAFEKKATILDGNVKRVLTRWSGTTADTRAEIENLWQIAEKMTPRLRIADYTQAIMDLGATVCVRGKPKCNDCPLSQDCNARDQGLQKNNSVTKKPLPHRYVTFFIIVHQEQILLIKRPNSGIWGGLWCFPESPGILTRAKILKKCEQLGYPSRSLQFEQEFRHTFTHFHLNILPVFITVDSLKKIDSSQQIWYNLSTSQPIGLPVPVKKLLAKYYDPNRSLQKVK